MTLRVAALSASTVEGEVVRTYSATLGSPSRSGSAVLRRSAADHAASIRRAQLSYDSSAVMVMESCTVTGPGAVAVTLSSYLPGWLKVTLVSGFAGAVKL